MKNIFDYLADFYDFFMLFWGLYNPQKILFYLKPAPTDVILDLGGGTGYLANRLKDYCKKMVVLDSSYRMLNKAKKYKGLILVTGDANRLPFKDKSFNKVLTVDLLHHIKNPVQVLKEIKRTVKKNILISEFSSENSIGKILKIWEHLFLRAHFIEPECLKSICDEIGFKGKINFGNSYEYFYAGEIEE